MELNITRKFVATNDSVFWFFLILFGVHSQNGSAGLELTESAAGEWYCFIYYLCTMEQSALRAWLSCSYAPSIQIFPFMAIADCCHVKRFNRFCFLDFFQTDKFKGSNQKHLQRSFWVCAQPMRVMLQCNVVSHWLGAYTKWSLHKYWCNLRHILMMTILVFNVTADIHFTKTIWAHNQNVIKYIYNSYTISNC